VKLSKFVAYEELLLSWAKEGRINIHGVDYFFI
jgi:hypothetical protein